MFIDQEELKTKLDNTQNLINILNPILGDKATNKVINEVLPEKLDETIDEVLENGVVINRKETRHIGHAGKVSGDSNIPQVLRNVIAIQANFGGVKETANQYGVSEVQARNLSQGIVNRGRDNTDPANAAMSKTVENAIGRVTDKVIKKIDMALDKITDDKLENREAKELSQIISNLSRVMPSMRKDDKGSGPAVSVVFMNPSPADAPVFKTIDV